MSPTLRQMKNIKLVIEYIGTRYHGWQRQPSLATLQGTLEGCIAKISGEQVTLIGAGRTDAGVHAAGQVANFKTNSRLDPQSWKKALNALLPEDIVILEARKVASTFHSRRTAKTKTYQYRILNRKTPSAFLHAGTWHFTLPLDLRSMQSAARPLVGLHDFTSFCGSSRLKLKTKSRLLSLSVRRRRDLILITLKGTGFLQYMARNIVGTLVQVGTGKIKAGEMAHILEARDRSQAGPTAPPQGLFLLKVTY